jgi:HEAT repeat protein
MLQQLPRQLRRHARALPPTARANATVQIESLTRARTALVDQIVALLADQQLGFRADPEVCTSLCRMLGQLQDQRAVPALLDLLADAQIDYTARVEAARALGYIGSTRATRRLIAMMEDTRQEDWLRGEAVGALGWLRDPRSDRALIAQAIDPEGTPWVRARAIEMLSQRNQAEADPDVLATIRTALRDPTPEVQRAAIFALANVGESADLTALKQIVAADQTEPTTPWSLRHDAEDAIRFITQRAAAARAEAE